MLIVAVRLPLFFASASFCLCISDIMPISRLGLGACVPIDASGTVQYDFVERLLELRSGAQVEPKPLFTDRGDKFSTALTSGSGCHVGCGLARRSSAKKGLRAAPHRPSLSLLPMKKAGLPAGKQSGKKGRRGEAGGEE
jgi:hypothetical protein